LKLDGEPDGVTKGRCEGPATHYNSISNTMRLPRFTTRIPHGLYISLFLNVSLAFSSGVKNNHGNLALEL
jgi:hypothetical protein